MNLFGKKKAEAPRAPREDPIETIKSLRDNLDTLEKREAHISRKIDACLEEAKQKAAKKDKKAALFALKRKKLYEKEVEKLQGARITLDQQIMALESATVNIETFKAMKKGADAMKGIRGNIDADKVDEMMDDMQEERDIHDAISEAISRPAQDMFDDDELLAELNELEELELEQPAPVYNPKTQINNSNSAFSLPLAPTTAINSNANANANANANKFEEEESEDERALRELQAAMLA